MTTQEIITRINQALTDADLEVGDTRPIDRDSAFGNMYIALVEARRALVTELATV